jgi:hypothetical protein
MDMSMAKQSTTFAAKTLTGVQGEVEEVDKLERMTFLDELTPSALTLWVCGRLQRYCRVLDQSLFFAKPTYGRGPTS